MRSVVAFLMAVMAYMASAHAFHFYLSGNEAKCFYQELSVGTLVVGKYKVDEWDNRLNTYIEHEDLGLAITVEEVFDNNQRVMNQRAKSSGEFAFTALESGEHRICFRLTSKGWFSSSKGRMFLDFIVGEEQEWDSKGEEKINSLSLKVKELNHKVRDIKREQALMREREAISRDQSESTNARVVRWTFIQLLMLGATCAWQLNHLRSFFMKQKLV